MRHPFPLLVSFVVFAPLTAGCRSEPTLHARAAESPPPAQVVAAPANAPEAPPAPVAEPDPKPVAEPEPARVETEPAPAAEPAADSVSLGYPNDGELENGVQLPLETPALRFNPNRRSTARYATREVLEAIVHAAQVVHDTLPGGRLTVNDLSLEGGGPIVHHGSHRNGRDADILFYLLDDAGEPIESVGAPLDPEGYGHDYKDLSIAEDDVRVHLDAARTWRFLQALLSDERAQVQRIFVVEHVRSMLLAEAERQKAPAAVVERFSHVSCQPGFPHDDHLHIRWFCDPDDIALGCEDMPPIYPRHRAWLAERGKQPVPAVRDRKPPPAKVFGHAEARNKARKKAGSLHPDVRAFLERRKAWLPAPHPGRRYCR